MIMSSLFYALKYQKKRHTNVILRQFNYYESYFMNKHSEIIMVCFNGIQGLRH